MITVTNFDIQAAAAERWMLQHQPNLNPCAGALYLSRELAEGGYLNNIGYASGNARQRRKAIRQLQRRGWKVRLFRGRQRGDEILFEYRET